MGNKTINENRSDARAHSAGKHVVRIKTEKNGGVLKDAAFALLIAIQLAVILVLYFGFFAAATWYIALSLVLSFICSIHVLSTDKPSQTKAIWVLFLMMGFSIGFIAYILSNEKIFFGRASKRYKKIIERAEKYTPEYTATDGLSGKVENDVLFLRSAGGFPACTGSDLKYYPSGAQFFDEILDAVKTAEKFVFIEFFIVADGALLNRFLDVLYEKVAQGVEVRIIADGMGSHGPLSSKTCRAMRKAGIKIYFFNRFLPRFTFALNLRDHRKIVVVDGTTAFGGGCNLADEYVNEKRLHGYWKDGAFAMRGAAVDGVTLMFLKQWEFVCRKQEDYSKYLGLYGNFSNTSVVVPYSDGKDCKYNVVRGLYSNIMSGADKKLYIMSPYFVPDEATVNLLEAKALAGVDVRLVLPEIPDRSYVQIVTLGNARKLAESGVKVLLMKQAFVHAKIIYNESCVSVGSANIDLRSYYNQFENGVFTDDPQFMGAVEQDFERVFEASVNINDKVVKYPLINRILTGIMRLFSPLM